MLRRCLVAAAVAVMVAPAALAAAAPPPTRSTAPASAEAQPNPAPSIQVRLACEPVRTPDDPERDVAIACEWSAVDSPRAAGYRLWRLVDPGDPGTHREVIFRTHDLARTRHLDSAVRPGHTFVYAVEVVGHDGGSLAWSEPVRVVLPPAEDRVEDLRLACALVRPDRERPDVHRAGIGCRWSASTSRAFAGYRLVRSDGDTRTVVFRTADRAATRHLDVEVRPGSTYTYVIEAVALDGRVIGSGGPAVVGFPP